jgi:carbon-monoxide dehydrogenase small subunit
MSDSLKIGLSVNGSSHVVNVTPRRLLSDVLREDLGLTGTHVGCEHGVCGACTVLIDGRPARACITFAIQMERHEVTTIEAVARNDVYSPLQQAMHEEHGLQCGFCTPGIIMTFEAYLRDNPDPSETEIRDVLSGNICRCTGYQGIVAAVKKAAADIRKRQP